MGYQVGVLITSEVEESFGDYHTEQWFKPLGPVRNSLESLASDLKRAHTWVELKIEKDRAHRKEWGPNYRGDSWNWGRWVDADPSREPPLEEDDSYTVFIRVLTDAEMRAREEKLKNRRPKRRR